MISIRRTNSEDNDFRQLVGQLDKVLAELDGNEHAFYSQFNNIEEIKYAVVVYVDDIPVSCGAIKKFDTESMEVKRMFTLEAYRGRGLAGKVLEELERWTHDLSLTRCVLETGKRQPDAIRLYEKNGYTRITNYGQYIGVENSICFEKKLNKI